MKSRSRVFAMHRLPALRMGSLVLREFPAACLPKDVSVMAERLPAGIRLPPVKHRLTSELVICLRGRFSVDLNGRAFALRPGSCVFIPPGVWHVFRSGRTSAEAISIFSPRLSLRRAPDVIVQTPPTKTRGRH